MKLTFQDGTFHGLAPEEVALFRRVLGGMSGIGVEIGCCDGFSTAHILDASQLHMTCIDPFVPDSMDKDLIGSEVRFRNNIALWKNRVSLVKEKSMVVAPFWRRKIDFLFIDGDHEYSAVVDDFVVWTRHLKKGGLLAMHDARVGREGAPQNWPGPSMVAKYMVFGNQENWGIVGEAGSTVVAMKLK